MANKLPSFASPVVWDSQTSYEALKVVIYDGHAYTSKQAVPAGTQLSNTNYWYPTGNIYKVISELSNALTNKLNWKFASDFTGQSYTEFNPPANYSELYIEALINGTNNIVNSVIPKHAVLRGGWVRSGGFGTSNSTGCLGVFNFSMAGSKIHIGLNNACLFGVDYTSNTTVNIYYR